MLATRFKNTNTDSNLSVLLKLIKDPQCTQVILFTSPLSVNTEFSSSDGLETNLPLVSAVAKYQIPAVDEVYIVFDGSFLTAARRTRYLEVRQLLDTAEKSDKVFFCDKRAPFTSSLEPVSAITKLLELQSILPFTSSSRATYFGLLSNIPEADLERT